MDDKEKEIAQQLCDAANKLPPAAQDKLLGVAIGMVLMSEMQQQSA